MSLVLHPEAPPGSYEQRTAQVEALSAHLRELAAKWRELAQRRRRENRDKPVYLAPFGWLLPFTVLYMVGQGGGGANALLVPDLGRPGEIVGLTRGKTFH